MIITCEACSKRYVISPDSLGPSGRIVKCSSCSHTWHQDPPEDMPKLLDENVSFAPAYSPSSFDSSSFSTSSTDTSFFSSEKQSPFIELPREPKPYNSIKKTFPIIKTFLFAFILGSFCAFLYFGRFHIVHHWPLTEKLYSMLGIQLNPLTHHLILKEISWSSSKDNQGLPIFTLKGQIQNLSNIAENIPPLTIVFIKESSDGTDCFQNNCIIDRWIAYTSTDKILPGENYPFQINLSKSIPLHAANLYVEFAKP